MENSTNLHSNPCGSPRAQRCTVAAALSDQAVMLTTSSCLNQRANFTNWSNGKTSVKVKSVTILNITVSFTQKTLHWTMSDTPSSLASWAVREMGYCGPVSPQNLSIICSGSMNNVWRWIVAHCLDRERVKTIRGNLVLMKKRAEGKRMNRTEFSFHYEFYDLCRRARCMFGRRICSLLGVCHQHHDGLRNWEGPFDGWQVKTFGWNSLDGCQSSETEGSTRTFQNWMCQVGPPAARQNEQHYHEEEKSCSAWFVLASNFQSVD